MYYDRRELLAEHFEQSEPEAQAFDRQAQLLHDALRVAAGLTRQMPPIDLFKRDESPCHRLVA